MADLTNMLNPVTLTPEQEKKWSDTRTALLWHAPAFSHIFYTLLQNNRQRNAKGDTYGAIFTDSEAIPIAATDGSNLIFKPETFFALTLNQRIFVVAHEIMHNILNHPVLGHMFRMRGKVAFSDGTELDYDHETMNVAEDYVINAILIDGNIGQMPTDAAGKQMGCYDTAIATGNDASLDTYRKIYKKPNPKGGGGGGNGPGPAFDTLLPPGSSVGQDPQTASNSRNQAQWQTEVASAMSAAKAMGKLPAGLQRVFEQILDPVVDWQEQIKAMFARKVGGGAYDFRKPDRRMITRDIYAPGRTGFAAGTVVVAVDTSGSIGQEELDMFMAEMSGIIEDVKPEQLVIIWCDAEVNRVDYAEDSDDLNTIRCKGAVGGGGTSFIPVFNRIDEEGLTPEALVYLTDGLGSFPNAAPNYPVIWGDILGSVKYPFGDVVNIPRRKK
jgi:predicted metal-dependent peptidase